MAWGYNILNPEAPLGGGGTPSPRKAMRVLIFLTDGLNTEDRYRQSAAAMDADMRALCNEAKAADVRLFTIRVVSGNDSLLRDCASDPSDFYTTNDAGSRIDHARDQRQTHDAPPGELMSCGERCDFPLSPQL